jgi:hypothetical protein
MQSVFSCRALPGLSRAICALAFLIWTVPAFAEDGVFQGLGGTWSGNGTMSLASGSRERLRCRAVYDAAQRKLDLKIRCASDSANFDLRGSVTAQAGGAIAGSWSEESRGVGGSVSGHASPGQINAVAEGQSFSANITVSTHGNKQSVSIRPSGGEIKLVSVALAKR